MVSLKRKLKVDELQQGNLNRNRFRENVRFTIFFAVTALILAVVYLYLIMKPYQRTFYVSTTAGSIVAVEPMQGAIPSRLQSTKGDGLKPLMLSHGR